MPEGEKLLPALSLCTTSMTAAGRAKFSHRAAARSGPIRWLILGGVLLVVAIVVGTAMMVGVFRERALNGAERELANTVLLLTRHFDQQLGDFVSVQDEVVAQIRASGLSSPDAFRGLMSTPEMHEVLRAKVPGHSDIAGVNVFDTGGKLINSSENWPLPNVNIADRNYFKAFKSGAATTPVLVELVRGRFVGGWATVISRGVTGSTASLSASSPARSRLPASRGSSLPWHWRKVLRFRCTIPMERCSRVTRTSMR